MMWGERQRDSRAHWPADWLKGQPWDSVKSPVSKVQDRKPLRKPPNILLLSSYMHTHMSTAAYAHICAIHTNYTEANSHFILYFVGVMWKREKTLERGLDEKVKKSL